MKPEISEFSYGFALTHELLLSPQFPIVGVPVFPSLIQEGQPGGGWDVRLQRPSVPLFLQFKLADYMKMNSCKEGRQGFPVPCYRMYIRPARLSEQHQMLLDLEDADNDVYYSAPAFHQPSELNDAFENRKLLQRSIWLRPSDIGELPDDEPHSVAFRSVSGPWEFFSERRDLRPRSFQEVAKHLAGRVREHGSRTQSREYWEQTLVKLGAIIESRSARAGRRRLIPDEARRQMEPIVQVAYDAAVFLELQLFVIQERN